MIGPGTGYLRVEAAVSTELWNVGPIVVAGEDATEAGVGASGRSGRHVILEIAPSLEDVWLAVLVSVGAERDPMSVGYQKS